MNSNLNGYAHVLFTDAAPTCKRNYLVISNISYCGASQTPTSVAICETVVGFLAPSHRCNRIEEKEVCQL
jgi:hypothetical protein